MENLSGPIIVEENKTHFLVGIHYNDRHLARDINGRAWDGEKRRWVWKRDRANYESLCQVFRNIAKRFEITDKELPDETIKKKKEVGAIEGDSQEGDWGFNAITDSWTQLKQLQSIEEKIDKLLESTIISDGEGKDQNEQRETTEEEIVKHRNKTKKTAPTKVQEVIADLTSDKAFKELILREEANQSPVQRVHNKIRDEIRQFKDATEEEIHETLTERFKKQKKTYYPGELNLVRLIWFAQEEKFYKSGGNEEPDIYNMLHLFNSTRVAVEKYDQTDEEMSKMYTVLCLSLGKIIWSRIRVRSMEIEEEYLESDQPKE
jgi:hypothetical protein